MMLAVWLGTLIGINPVCSLWCRLITVNGNKFAISTEAYTLEAHFIGRVKTQVESIYLGLSARLGQSSFCN